MAGDTTSLSTLSLNEQLEIMGTPSLVRQLNSGKALGTQRVATHNEPESIFGRQYAAPTFGGHASD